MQESDKLDDDLVSAYLKVVGLCSLANEWHGERQGVLLDDLSEWQTEWSTQPDKSTRRLSFLPGVQLQHVVALDKVLGLEGRQWSTLL
jgi:hypothetical protein